MIELLNTSGPVVALRLKGEVSVDDVAAVKKAFDEALGKNERIGVVMDLTEFSDATDEAIRADVRFELGMLQELPKFGRVAMVTDKNWLGMALKSLGRLLPSVEAKVFRSGQTDAAVKWAADLGKNTTVPADLGKPAGLAFKPIATESENVYAFEIDGTLRASEVPAITEELSRFLDTKQKVRMLGRIKHFGFDPAILLQRDLFSTKISAIQKLERYALVGAPEWMAKVIAVVDPLFPGLEIRAFPADSESEAWAWIGAQPSRA